MSGSRLIALVVLMLAWAANGQPLTRESFVRQVLDGSAAARALDAQHDLEAARSGFAGGWSNPVLTWEREAPFGEPAGSGQDLLRASVPLVVSGRLGLLSDSAAAGVSAAEARRRRGRAQLRREAELAYSAVLAAGMRRRIFDGSIKSVAQVHEALVARERAGEAAGYDLVRVQVERALLEAQVEAAGLEEDQERSAAAALLGAPLPSELEGAIVLSGPAVAAGDDPAALSRITERRADLRALSLEAEAASFRERAAARQWIPDLELGGGPIFYGAGTAESSAGYAVGLSVTLPIFQHGQRERGEAAAERALAEARRERTVATLQATLQSARRTLSVRAERLTRHETQTLPRVAELRKIARAAYRGGASEIVQLLDAERVAREAELVQVELALEVARAHAQVALHSGEWDDASAQDGENR